MKTRDLKIEFLLLPILFSGLLFSEMSSASFQEVIGSMNCVGEVDRFKVLLTGSLSANCPAHLENTATTVIMGKLSLTFDFGKNGAPASVIPFIDVPVKGDYEGSCLGVARKW